MFPIRDHNPSGRIPIVTYALIAANVLVFLAMLPLYGEPDRLLAFFETWALIPWESDPITYVSSMFLHAGVMHVFGNMLFLFIFGDNLEDEMGHLGFLSFYLTSGVLAGLAHTLSAPDSTIPTVGASGGIAGVMGAYLLLYPRARVDVLIIIEIFFRIFPVPAWLMLGLWFGFQLLNAGLTDPDLGGVAYWAHAGGFVIGLTLAIPTWLRLGGQVFWSRTHGHPRHPDASYRLTGIPRTRRRK